MILKRARTMCAAPRGRPARAFTLLEMVIVITVIAILAGSLVPVLTRPYVSEYRVETLAEMEAIVAGILGKPEQGDYGFLGSMGRLPNPLSELWLQGTNSAVTYNTHGGIPMGWAGPYMRSQFQRPDRDAWGNAYVIETSGTSYWRLRSWGPDGAANTADDIVFPQPDPAGIPIYYFWNGTLTLDLLVSDGTFVRYLSSNLAKSVALSVTVGKQTNAGAEQNSNSWTNCSVTGLGGVPVGADAFQTQASCSNVAFGLHDVHVHPASPTTQLSDFDQNVLVSRVNTYAYVLMDPPLLPSASSNTPPAPGEGMADMLSMTSTTSFTKAAVVNLTTPAVLAPMKFDTYLDFEITGTLTPSDATTTCKVWLEVDGVAGNLQFGQVQVGNAPNVEVPFHLSVNAKDLRYATTLGASAQQALYLNALNGSPITVAVQAQATATSTGSCTAGRTTSPPVGVSALSGVQALVFHTLLP